MNRELGDLKKARDKLSGLEKQLCDAWANFSIEHANHVEREHRQRQERSHRENLELSKRETEKIKLEARVCTELENF